VAELVFSRYSEAFFDLARQTGQMERFADDAKLVLTALDTSPQAEGGSNLGEFLCHPQISEADKIGVLEASLKGKVADETVGLIVVIIRKQRESELADILRSFLKKVDEFNRLAQAHITSAVPIDEGRLETIRGILSEKFGKKIVITTSIDKDLIGGLKVLIQGYSFDRTIKGSINELKAGIY